MPETIIDLVMAIQPQVRPDGSLNEEQMVSEVLNKVAEVNRAQSLIQPEDTMIGIVLSESGGAVEAIARFTTSRSLPDSGEFLEGVDVYVSIRHGEA